MANAIIWIIIALVIIVAVLAIFAKFYQRATQEISLVKTGIGGRKIIIDGGTIAIPWFHEISKVNMQTSKRNTHGWWTPRAQEVVRGAMTS